ncbi:MAG TPA: saccharopine dehydrogenase C-terminal domain-containing protein, partial [Roseimicrobium sp.]|nr:saccharopine dehydrogenase C-terminal domain-containing protein [Roseimicrobium sp.]
FEAALAARVAYIDLGGLGTWTVRQLAEHARFAAAGVTAVIGAGADPGMSNVICRAVADELDEIDKINLYWAAELVGPENPVLCPPYSVSTVLAEYAHPSTQFLDGRHVQCAPLQGREFLSLPEPWGDCEFMYSPHSEQLTVPLAEGIKEKGIQEFTWKLHLPHREHEAWIGLIKAGFNDFEAPLSVGGVTIAPVDFLTALIQRNLAKNADKIPVQDSHEIHLAIGRGRKNGQAATVRCEVIVSPNPMYAPYVDACTSMNASIAAQLILASPLRAGVFAPESYFDVPSYFRELERRHFAVSIRTEPC